MPRVGGRPMRRQAWAAPKRQPRAPAVARGTKTAAKASSIGRCWRGGWQPSVRSRRAPPPRVKEPAAGTPTVTPAVAPAAAAGGGVTTVACPSGLVVSTPPLRVAAGLASQTGMG